MDPDPDSLEMMVPDPDSLEMMDPRIPQHCTTEYNLKTVSGTLDLQQREKGR
jgi:hypothetical protein